MDPKTAAFRSIGCDEAKQSIITCAQKQTDRITWGRLLKHLRECHFCRQLFIAYHQSQIADVASLVISREILAEHRHYALAEEVIMHFTKEQLEHHSNGDFTDDELALITEHICTCHDCKLQVPASQ